MLRKTHYMQHGLGRSPIVHPGARDPSNRGEPLRAQLRLRSTMIATNSTMLMKLLALESNQIQVEVRAEAFPIVEHRAARPNH